MEIYKRVAVFSDIHANLQALKNCLEDLDEINESYPGIVKCWCLGDLCGYGPDALETVRIAKLRFDDRIVAGNHDIGVVMPNIVSEQMSVPLLNTDAGILKVSALMTGLFHRSELRRDPDIWKWFSQIVHRYVKDQPPYKTDLIGNSHIYFLHSPYNDFSYLNASLSMIKDVTNAMKGTGNLENIHIFPGGLNQDVIILLSGHTHIPMWSYQHWDQQEPSFMPILYDRPMQLQPGVHLINPGSVGQPRDGEIKPRYAVLENNEKGLFLQFRHCKEANGQTVISLRQWLSLWKEQISKNVLLDEEKRTLEIHIRQKNILPKRNDLQKKIDDEADPFFRELLVEDLKLLNSNGLPVVWKTEIDDVRIEMEKILTGTISHREKLAKIYDIVPDGMTPK